MRVLIAGIDGYLGWSLAVCLASRGDEVFGIDNLSRRKQVAEVGGDTVIPIKNLADRMETLSHRTRRYLALRIGDLTDIEFVRDACRDFIPEAIVYLGEMPSAAYSMIDAEHAVFTQTNNVIGTLVMLHAMRDLCSDAHLVKLGTLGEYGTPDSDIPEGTFPNGASWEGGDLSGLMFPRRAGSWYHQSKVHDTHNIEMACRFWNLRATDIMQGVVYGTRGGPRHELVGTRCDVDQCFGTVIHRFCAQAVIGDPLTIYGTGEQKRGFLPLRDSMQCLQIALDNPPSPGEYRTFNQFAEVHSICELAEIVRRNAAKHGLSPTAAHIDNPRIETGSHYYAPRHQTLFDMGYKPHGDIDSEVHSIIGDMLPHAERIAKHRGAVSPSIKWNPAA